MVGGLFLGMDHDGDTDCDDSIEFITPGRRRRIRRRFHRATDARATSTATEGWNRWTGVSSWPALGLATNRPNRAYSRRAGNASPGVVRFGARR